jgi:hypothetical protein
MASDATGIALDVVVESDGDAAADAAENKKLA